MSIRQEQQKRTKEEQKIEKDLIKLLKDTEDTPRLSHICLYCSGIEQRILEIRGYIFDINLTMEQLEKYDAEMPPNFKKSITEISKILLQPIDDFLDTAIPNYYMYNTAFLKYRDEIQNEEQK